MKLWTVPPLSIDKTFSGGLCPPDPGEGMAGNINNASLLSAGSLVWGPDSKQTALLYPGTCSVCRILWDPWKREFGPGAEFGLVRPLYATANM